MTQVQLDQMKFRHKPGRHSKRPENGYVLLAAIFLLALLVLSLSVAVPIVRRDIQREREREAIRRGSQYRRALQLYYRKFHVYPPSLKALEGTDDIRFLRKRYIDPITGKNDWVPIQFGNNKVPTNIGFFGQEITRTSIAGTGPGTPQAGSSQNPTSNGTSSSSDQTSGTPSNSDQAGGTPSNSNQAGGTPSNSNQTGGTPSNSDQTGGTLSNSNQTNNQTLGGAGIIGVSIPTDKSSLVAYKQQDHYNLWEFVYDPIQDLVSGAVAGTGTGGNPGTPANSPSSPNSNAPASGPSNGPPTAPGSAPTTPQFWNWD